MRLRSFTARSSSGMTVSSARRRYQSGLGTRLAAIRATFPFSPHRHARTESCDEDIPCLLLTLGGCGTLVAPSRPFKEAKKVRLDGNIVMCQCSRGGRPVWPISTAPTVSKAVPAFPTSTVPTSKLDIPHISLRSSTDVCFPCAKSSSPPCPCRSRKAVCLLLAPTLLKKTPFLRPTGSI